MIHKNRLYAMPTTQCNLSCSHCDIKDQLDVYDRDKFIDALNNFENGEILLFGGEVTTNLDRMFDIIKSNLEYGKSKIKHISTNLLILNDDLLKFYKDLGGISTSWNPDRFNPDQYELWKKNCKIVSDNDISYRVMITLTENLFDIPIEEFLEMAATWIHPKLIEIKFEHYVGDVTKEYFKKADQWLCELYKGWNIPVTFETINRIGCWHFDCDNVYTLFPDGQIVNSCPHKKNAIVITECYSCDRVNECRPCRLQPYCQYPHEFAKLVNSIHNGGDPDETKHL